MSESSQRHGLPPKDPVRIVYHAENRTFARLFNERSLDEVKDVVRRKLSLGCDTDVSLKQMGPNALLDLEDDDDFQAFCILLRSSDSVDVQVIVGRSQGSAVPPPIASSREKPSVGEPLITSLTSHPKEPTIPAQPKVTTTTKVSAATKKTLDPSARKRKVSFDGAALETSDKPAKKHDPSKSPEPTEEPPQKKRRKEKVKASDTRKAKVKKSATLDRESEAGTSAPRDIETSEEPAKNPRKKRGKQSEPIETDGTDSPNHQLSNPVNEASLLPAAETPEKPGLEGTWKAVPKPPVIGVCASIPQTSACTSVLSELTAVILSGYLPKPSETPPPEPPAKRKSVRRTTTESFTSSTLPAESTTVSHASAKEIPTVLTERRLEAVVPNSESPQQTLELNGPWCPICLEVPFHIRYCCPTVQKGPDAIRERLEELKRTNNTDQQSLIKELESLLRDSKVTSKPAVSTDDVQSREVSQLPDASVSRTPNIPSNSYLSEVTVESRNEGSSSESSDDISEGETEYKGLPVSRGQETPGEQPSPSNDDLEAVIRGPTSRRQSILGIFDRIVGDEDDGDSNSEDEEAELEEDPDEGIVRSMRRLSKLIRCSSDSESEEESRPPSSSRSDEDVSNSLKSGVHDSNKAAAESVEHEDDDAVARNSHDPPVFRGQDGDSSEETHVGSEDRMVVDGSIGEKGVAVTVEEQLSSPVPQAPILQSSDAPIEEPQVSGETADGPTSDQGGNFKAVEPDPIEPVDEMEPPNVTRLSNPDPIEAPFDDVGSFFVDGTQPTPAPGVARRLQTRHGQILDDEADRPVLLDQLSLEVPLSTKRKSRKKDTEVNSQEPATTRKSPRFSSVPPVTSTPAAISLLNHRAKAKAAKTPAKRFEERSDALQNGARDDVTRNGARITATPSLWETLVEPSSSPSIHPDEPSVLLDELMPSSPHSQSNHVLKCPNVKGKKGQTRTSQAGSSQGSQRLFDLTPSQIPFPYSQHKNSTSTVLPNEKEKEVSTDSEEEPKVIKKKSKLSAPYRTLSQLASQATLYSPSLPAPTNKNVTNGKAKKRAAAENSSSSSSSSEEEANESTHIPRGRKAGSVLATKKRKKSILLKI